MWTLGCGVGCRGGLGGGRGGARNEMLVLLVVVVVVGWVSGLRQMRVVVRRWGRGFARGGPRSNGLRRCYRRRNRSLDCGLRHLVLEVLER